LKKSALTNEFPENIFSLEVNLKESSKLLWIKK